jgi:hypothetical protein
MVGRNYSRGGNPNRPPLQNIVAMISEIITVDQRGKSTPWTKELEEKSRDGTIQYDYAWVYLTHDITDLGLKAEWADDGAPLTRMKLVMPEPYDPASGKPLKTERRDLAGLKVKKAGGPPMDEGALVNFEKVWVKDGVLYAHYSRGGPTAEDQRDQRMHTFSNLMVCVLPEGTKRDAQGREVVDEQGVPVPAGKQEALISDHLGGEIVTDEVSLRAAIDSLMQNSRIGTPGFQLHCRAIAPEGVDEAEFAADPETRNSGFIIAKPKPVGEGEARVWVAPTTDEIIERLWKSFRGLSDCFGKPGFEFEFVPMMAVHQAPTLTPSNKKNDKGRDNSKTFQIHDVVDPATGELGVTDYGWTQCHVTVVRMSADSDYYFATYQKPISTRADIYALPDVPTQLMQERHPGHFAAVKAEAKRLGENKATVFKARAAERDAAPAPGAAAPR